MINWKKIELKHLTPEEKKAVNGRKNHARYAQITVPILFDSYEDALTQLVNSDVKFLSYPIHLRNGKVIVNCINFRMFSGNLLDT